MYQDLDLSPDEETYWHPVPGFEGYDVSSDGQVRSWKGAGGTMRLLKQTSSRGYLHVALNGVTCQVHGLVLLAFDGPRPDGLTASHLNGRPGDNRAANLAWETLATNIGRQAAHGTKVQGETHYCARLRNHQVLSIRRSKESAATLAARYDVSTGTIYNVRNRRTWTHI